MLTEINFDLLLEDMSETVLTEAVKGGDMRVIELLVEHGASTTTHNFSGTLQHVLYVCKYVTNIIFIHIQFTSTIYRADNIVTQRQ